MMECVVDQLPSGGVAFDLSDCFDYMRGRISFEDVCVAQGFVPPADIAETEQHYRMTLEIPGLDVQSMDIRYENGMLNVKGNKLKESEAGECCHCAERVGGVFERSFRIPGPVDEDNIEATYNDGILKLTVPKSEKQKARQIEIK